MSNSTDTKLRNFFHNYPIKYYDSGQTLITPGEQPSGLFYLAAGSVRQYAVTTDGNELTLNTFKSGSFFPVDWVINDTKISYFFETTSRSQLYMAPRLSALNFIKSEPEIMFDLLQRVYRGLIGYFQRMEQLMSGQAKSRLITEIVILAKRFGKNQGKCTEVLPWPSEKAFASQTGLTRETVSREMQKLKRAQFIKIVKNKPVLIDLPALEKELHSVST